MDGLTVALILVGLLGGVVLALLATVRLVSLVVHGFLTVFYYVIQAGQNQHANIEEPVVKGFGGKG